MSDKLRSTIQEITNLTAEVGSEIQLLGDKLFRLQLLLDRLGESTPSPELIRIQRRLDRVRELRNMMELGSLSIEIRREMDEAWRRLP